MGDFCVQSYDSCSKKMSHRCSATHATLATHVSIPPKSYAFHLQKHCSQTPTALLSDSKNNALGLQKQCSWTPKAMLWALRSNALEVTELCSGGYGAMLYRGTELCSVGCGAVLCMVWSSTRDGHMRCCR